MGQRRIYYVKYCMPNSKYKWLCYRQGHKEIYGLGIDKKEAKEDLYESEQWSNWFTRVGYSMFFLKERKKLNG